MAREKKKLLFFCEFRKEQELRSFQIRCYSRAEECRSASVPLVLRL
jgi:hypothetical protein